MLGEKKAGLGLDLAPHLAVWLSHGPDGLGEPGWSSTLAGLAGLAGPAGQVDQHHPRVFPQHTVPTTCNRNGSSSEQTVAGQCWRPSWAHFAQ